MKILNINSYYFSSSVHEQLQKSICVKMKSYSYVPLSSNYSIRKECEEHKNSNVILSPCFTSLDRYFFHLKHYKILKDIEEKIQINSFNIIHAHSLFSNGYIAYQLNKKYNIPYIVAVRDTDVNIFFKRMIHLRRLGLKILIHATKIIFLSTPYMEICLNKYIPSPYQEIVKKKIEIIPNGIDEYWHRNSYCQKNIQNKKDIKLIFAGQISRRKNLIKAKEAADILISRGYSIKFRIIGECLDKRILDELTQISYIEYIKRVNKEKLIELYRESDIFIMPSLTETFGLVYAEAMSQGLPVIYTKNQGFDGQFKEGIVGYHVECQDEVDIANKIEKIIHNYSIISSNCIKLSKRFDWNLISNRYIKLYNKLNL